MKPCFLLGGVISCKNNNMNKETRTFIFGLIMLFVGGIATAIHLIALVNNTFIFDLWNCCLLFFSITGAYIGISKVYSTIN